MNPRPLRNCVLQGSRYVQEVLGEADGDTRLRQLTRLSEELFQRFVEKVTHSEIVREGALVTIDESCVIFLTIMHLRLSNRQAQKRFQHSGATIMASFRAVLVAVNSVRGTYITGELVETCVRRYTHNVICETLCSSLFTEDLYYFKLFYK